MLLLSCCMAHIRASRGPVSSRGSLAHARRRPFLIVDSGWPTIEDELNIDSSLLLPFAEGRMVCRLELMVPSTHWAGERLLEPFPTDTKPGSLVLDEGAVTQRCFDGPVTVLAAESKSRIRIVLDDTPASDLVALSPDCIARLGDGVLLGFDIRRFTRK